MKREGKKRAREISRNDVKEKEYLFHFSGTSENVVKALLDLDADSTSIRKLNSNIKSLG